MPLNSRSICSCGGLENDASGWKAQIQGAEDRVGLHFAVVAGIHASEILGAFRVGSACSVNLILRPTCRIPPTT